MPTTMLDTFVKRIHLGLARKSLDKCSEWALKYRMMGKPFPGPWTFKYHPWLREMHDSKAQHNVGQKSAQMGYTELLLNWVFYKIDIEQESCLYLLPTRDDATDFSASRFDPALESSPHLRNLFNSVKNTGLKRSGLSTLFVRGTKSPSGLISIPVANIAYDELDRMSAAAVTLAEERTSGQMDDQDWKISTPTIPGHMINKSYTMSTEEELFFKCPHCSRSINMNMEFDNNMYTGGNLVIEGEHALDPKVMGSYLQCTHCKGRLEHEEKHIFLKDSQFVQQKDSVIRGFYVNQLYSSTVKPSSLAIKYFKSLNDPADEQELHNSKLGRPHITAGGRIEEYEIQECKGPHHNKMKSKGKLVTMGIDVGKWLHFWIDEWTVEHGLDINTASTPRTIYIGKVAEFEELPQIVREWSVNQIVIDANPERRKAVEFCNIFYGMAKVCFYGNGVSGRTLTTGTVVNSVTVDRTSWLETALDRFHKKSISVPNDIPMEAVTHLMNTVKVYEKDRQENTVAKFINSERADHYAHARNYSEIALKVATASASNEDYHAPK